MDHGVAARFYLLVIVFCRSKNAAIWPGGLWNGKDARGDELTNLCQKVATHHPVACLGLRASCAPACRVPLAQWLEQWSYEP